MLKKNGQGELGLEVGVRRTVVLKKMRRLWETAVGLGLGLGLGLGWVGLGLIMIGIDLIASKYTNMDAKGMHRACLRAAASSKLYEELGLAAELTQGLPVGRDTRWMSKGKTPGADATHWVHKHHWAGSAPGWTSGNNDLASVAPGSCRT
ncbi:hypothetical protein B0H13DRAFT_2274057 [Mycena leptocephala]|nr:hypothetical protein B0H13DRAFT_2274057 [Mycena leptocephala]